MGFIESASASRWIFAGLLMACGGKTVVGVERYELDVPKSWEVRRQSEGNHHALSLLAPGREILCRVEIFTSDVPVPPAAAEEFLAIARRDFQGADARPVRFRTRVGPLLGFSVPHAVLAEQSRGQTFASEVSVYSGVFGNDVIAAIGGGWPLDAEGRGISRDCQAALRSLRRSPPKRDP